ncbi:MAG: hypothetical protein KDB26_13385, partial [Microthrixaceae bacterium]|nr:hypothetical protein [Microthrixaceae bacterium]
NGTVVSKQAYTGAGDSSAITLNAAGTVTEITVGLAGGGLYTWRPSGGDVWSHGNTHGDLVLTCTTAGVQTGTIGAYDPFGNPLGVTSIDNSAGNFDYGWHGQAQRPLEHETGIQATIEMGARPYQPALGRFLTIDPIEGGTPNDYLYVTDPIGQSDLDGLRCWAGTNPNGSCRGSRQVRAVGGAAKTVGKKTYQVARYSVNELNRSNSVGRMAARTSGASCSMNWDQIMMVCSGGKSTPLVRKGGTTYGSYFVTTVDSKKANAPALMRHEAVHANQWAVGSWMFAAGYGAASSVQGECNYFERQAGFRDGGYRNCA